jgi:hypothetical protein
MARLGIICGSAAAGLSRRSEEVRSDANLLAARADSGANPGHNFCVALTRRKRT